LGLRKNVRDTLTKGKKATGTDEEKTKRPQTFNHVPQKKRGKEKLKQLPREKSGRCMTKNRKKASNMPHSRRRRIWRWPETGGGNDTTKKPQKGEIDSPRSSKRLVPEQDKH